MIMILAEAQRELNELEMDRLIAHLLWFLLGCVAIAAVQTVTQGQAGVMVLLFVVLFSILVTPVIEFIYNSKKHKIQRQIDFVAYLSAHSTDSKIASIMLRREHCLNFGIENKSDAVFCKKCGRQIT